MTDDEREQLEKDYPQINWDRMKRALLYCIIIMVATALVL